MKFFLPAQLHASIVILVWLLATNALANPTGMRVASGSATARSGGSQLTITTGNHAVLDWQSFNIAAGETTVFNQPSAFSIVVNNIHDASASQIYGSLQANGLVVLMNQNGFYFGPNSFVQTGGLIVSTANCIPPQNSGGSWEFNGPPPLASIVNYGQIKVGHGGSAFLIADQVANYGDIEAPGGTIGLASGQTVLLSERPDGRGMSMQVTLPGGSVDNDGTLVADAGTIALQAKVVNQNGLIQANSVHDQNGVIELVASDNLNLGANSQIIARGDDSAGGSAGGVMTLQSGNNFNDAAGSRISAAGGSQGGNGGSIEISAPNIGSLNSSMDASACSGWKDGTFFLDPVDIILDSSTANGAIDVNSAYAGFSQILIQASGNITFSQNLVWNLSGSTGTGSGQLTLNAGGNIIFDDASQIFDANQWSVTLNAGYNSVNHKVQAGVGNIYLNGGSGQPGGGSIQTAQGSVHLTAGQDITVGSGFVITTGGGSINAHALAGNIDTGSDAQGYHFQSADSPSEAYDLSDGLGGISTAAGGDVTLIAGGNVTTVLPGNGIYFYDGTASSPFNGDDYVTGGSGAYGNQKGNVTIVAGGNVTGNYVVANGTGSIYAGAKMDADGNPVVALDADNNPILEKDANGNPITDAGSNPVYVYALDSTSTGTAGVNQSNEGLALNLINGGWNVAAVQNIILQEVRNPNGIFNVNPGGADHYFDYSPDDYVNLSAGNLVQLGAPSAIPRLTGEDTLKVPVIYPSILNIAAGAGGVILDGGTSGSSYNQLILFPSPAGSLTINTTQGGSLLGYLPTIGQAPPSQIFNLIVSDAGHNQYTPNGNFGINDHAATPVHSDNSTPIVLNISGDMNRLFLGAPESAQINVGGDMVNCGFQGMNLSADPDFQVQIQEADGSTHMVTVDPGVTSINVAGDIYNRSAFTSIDLSQVAGAEAPDLSVLARAITAPSDASATTLATSFFYNGTTLTYENIAGANLATVLNLLENLTIQKVDQKGNLLWLDQQQTIPDTETVSVLNSATAQALLAQFNALGAIPATANGYSIGGGGKFNVSARSIDLGTSAGIQSKGVGLYTVRGNYPLAGLFGTGHVFSHGTDISVTTTGNHSAGVTATGDLIGDLDMYSSSIASLNGGSISINAGADINAGSSVFSVNTLGIRGIYSTSQGDVSVIAGADLNINGSRIATYDGGNITVESLNGSVNAGTGASSVVQVGAYYEDPITRIVYFDNPGIPFSGIDALTFAARDAFYPAPTATLGNILVEAPNGNINANVAGILQIPLNHLNYPDAVTMVLAGYELRDSLGNRVMAGGLADGTSILVSPNRNIVANGSGIIASNAKLDASGDIIGLIFARNNIDISAQQNVNVTALGIGTVNVSSSGGTISGTIVGVGGVNVSGSSIDASLISANITGATSGQSGLGQGTAANATSQSASNDDSNKATDGSDTTNDDDLKKKEKGISLAQKVSRVTVILPPKDLSENQNSRNPL